MFMINKIRTSSTLLPETVDWIDSKIEKSIFRSVSHAIDYLVAEARREEEKAGD
jgi:Arc/MetJ-type ribon-helix-helix transcriptional regulator